MRLTFTAIRIKTLWLLLREDRISWLILLKGLVLHCICNALVMDCNEIEWCIADRPCAHIFSRIGGPFHRISSKTILGRSILTKGIVCSTFATPCKD
jgi:hypothetical protein